MTLTNGPVHRSSGAEISAKILTTKDFTKKEGALFINQAKQGRTTDEIITIYFSKFETSFSREQVLKFLNENLEILKHARVNFL